MRKLIVWNMMTLDGFFEGPNPWEIDWHEYVWGDELEAFSLAQGQEAGAVLFGRKTYEGMAAHWMSAEGEVAEFMNEIPKLVFSNTLEAAEWRNTRLVRGRAEDELPRLKEESGKDLFIFGSAELTDALTQRGLVDEYRVALNPLLLGGGNPLFKPSDARIRLQLLEARPMATGVVILRYGRTDAFGRS